VRGSGVRGGVRAPSKTNAVTGELQVSLDGKPSGKVTKFTYVFQFKVRHKAP